MYAHELFEQGKPRVVVTYPGRFQPFHQGHAGVFAQLQKKFGSDNVFIATSNDQSSAKSPFNFSDKVQLMTAAGIPADKIYQTTAMYSLPDGFDPASTVFVTAVGAPDADRLRPDSVLKKDKKDKEGNIIKPAGSPGYYRTWGSDQTPMTADQVGYVVIIPEIHKSIKIKGQEYDVSHGTECRNLWNTIRDDAQARKEFLSQMYSRPSQELAAIFDKIPESANEDIAQTDSNYSSSPISGARVFHEEASGVIASKKQANDPRYSMSLTQDVRPGQIKKNLKAFRLAENEETNKIAIAALDFYKNNVGNVKADKVEDYNEKAKLLLSQASPELKSEVLEILKKGQKNPYIQGGIITTVGSLLAGGLIASAQQMQLNPTQTNILLQAVLNTVIPTLVSKINGKSWLDTIKYTVASAVIGTGIAAIAEDEEVEEQYAPIITPPGLKSPAQQAAAQLGHPLEEDSIDEKDMMRMVKEFLPLAMKELKVKRLPRIVLQKHVTPHDGQATFGRFVNEEETVYLGIADRHPVDILRTLAHELVHFKQYEDGKMYPGAGETGSPIENEAHWVAGIIMRHFNKKYPKAIQSKPLELSEDEADEIGKQKNLIPFPKGTVKVDVSDVYDWYKLGQSISDLDDANPEDFGKGPPQTVMAFGSEPEEHRYLKDLNRLGLKTHDIDEDKDECPPATQNIKLNLKNRQKAIDEYGYGPLNPNLPNVKFWMKKVDEWNLDNVEEAQQSLCGNCAAFDQRQHTLDCIAQGIDKDMPQDAEAVINAGDLGYCKFLKFKCASRRTCDAWVIGGPITDNVDENFADGRNPQDKGDSKRHGVPTKSSVSNLRKFAKSHSGRAAQLAHWMANMKAGKRKKK